MKKFSVYILLSFLLFACNSKQEEIEEITNEHVEKIPNEFTQKLLIEYSTSTRVGVAPEVKVFIDREIKKRPTKIIPIAIQARRDPMTLTFITDYYEEKFKLISCIPAGLVNRRQSPYRRELDLSTTVYEWQPMADTLFKKEKTSVGVAIQTVYQTTNKTISISAKVGFGEKTDISAKYKLLVYLTEDGLIYPQKNDFSYNEIYKDFTHLKEYYYKPSIIQDYVHNSVLRHIFSSLEGDEIEVNKINRAIEKSYTFQLNEEKYQNCNVIAAVIKEVNGKAWIENVQTVKLGKNQSWD